MLDRLLEIQLPELHTLFLEHDVDPSLFCIPVSGANYLLAYSPTHLPIYPPTHRTIEPSNHIKPNTRPLPAHHPPAIHPPPAPLSHQWFSTLFVYVPGIPTDTISALWKVWLLASGVTNMVF